MLRLSVLLALAFTVLPRPADPLDVQVTPRSSFAPATLRVTAIVDPHPDNRNLTIVADSLSYRSSTTLPLEGEDEALTHVVMLKSIPAGEYTIQATVTRVDGTTIERITTASIVD